MNKNAVVLLSGGLDSATTLYIARARGYRTFCLIFDYGQRHRREVRCAVCLARGTRSAYQVTRLDLPLKGSSLTDRKSSLPKGRLRRAGAIPNTYVPARNIIFLSIAAAYAESMGACAIFIGANAVDYSGYPDCRPEFFRSYRRVIAQGSKAGLEGKAARILTPLINKSKAQIIKVGQKFCVPYELTWSCYRGGANPCGVCDSCLLRAKGFEAAGVADPLLLRRKE